MSTANPTPPPRFQAGTQSVTVEQRPLAVAMTDGHYKRVQQRVRKEIKGTHTASIWVALALAAFGVLAALVITAAITEIPDAAKKGELEVAAWAAGGFVLAFVLVHVLTYRDAEDRADDVIAEMDTYCYRTVGQPVEAGTGNGT